MGHKKNRGGIGKDLGKEGTSTVRAEWKLGEHRRQRK